MSDRGSAGPAGRLAVLLWIGAILVSAAVGFASYHLLLPPADRITPAAVATTAPSAAAGDAVDAGESSPDQPDRTRVPEKLPGIRLEDLEGRPHRLTDWQGRDVVVNFWATWCDPCRREIPLLQSLRRERGENGLEIVGIAIDHREEVQKYAAEERIDYPLLVGEKDGLAAAEAFGMETVLPFSVFADRQGRVVTLKIGELHRDEAELILERIRDVDAGRLTLSSAQAKISEGMRKRREAHAGSG